MHRYAWKIVARHHLLAVKNNASSRAGAGADPQLFTARASTTYTFTEQKSKFIARLHPLQTHTQTGSTGSNDNNSSGGSSALPAINEQAKELIQMYSRSVDPKASHHCWAYSCVSDTTTAATTATATASNIVSDERFSDDGEVSGTAGRQILTAIQREGLSNVLICVTRYYGGVKLGTGGLQRAYYHAAIEACKTAHKVQVAAAVQTVQVHHLEGDTGMLYQIANSVHSQAQAQARAGAAGLDSAHMAPPIVLLTELVGEYGEGAGANTDRNAAMCVSTWQVPVPLVDALLQRIRSTSRGAMDATVVTIDP